LDRGTKGAREIAYEVLSAVEKNDAFADRALDATLEQSTATDDRDRALATELVYGVLRQRGLLDRVLRHHARLSLEQLDREVLRILRLGAYQILFLSRIPDHAAVGQSVELAKRVCPLGSIAFLNAVLRAICRTKNSHETKAILQAVEEGQPLWLVELWKTELGADLAHCLLQDLSFPPETIFRANLIKTSLEELLGEMDDEGYEAEPCYGLPGALRIKRGGDVRRSKAYNMGKCIQQDLASQLVTWILNPLPGHKVLDCCAAPGIKTTHISEKMENRGLLVAVDRQRERLEDLVHLCEQMAAEIVQPVCADAAYEGGIPIKGIMFDRVLTDVPCSGLGTLRRTPERKWREPPNFNTLSFLQSRILETASRLLSPGGVLVYSTCTVVHQENDSVIEKFLSEHSDFIQEDASKGLPRNFHDLVDENGFFRSWLRPHAFDLFFAARLRRL
jgi:16S rRNA (cytosine967-C5)-methyltransferase